MALIIDPDQLIQNTEVVINTTAKTIQLLIAGNLSTDGVTLKALYSFLKEEWKTDSALIKFPFPMSPITDEQYEFVNDWNLADAQSKYLIRTGGWAVKSGAGASIEEWAGIVTLGAIGELDQVYFQQEIGGSAQDIQLTGPVNQAVQIYGDLTHGDLDVRDYFKIFVREYQKLYAQAELTDIGVSSMTYQVYRFPLSNADDLKITHNDTEVSTTTPYTSMGITYYGTPQSRTIGLGSYNFDIIINGAGGTTQQIYEFVQWSLRQSTDIDDGAGNVIGETADALLSFVGDTLVTAPGVFIDNFDPAYTNSIDFYDNTGTLRTFPFVAAGIIAFNDNLQNDADAVYRMFFTDANGNEFGTALAILVNDKDGVPISGNVTGQSSVSFTFDYDGNVQGGRTAGQDAAVTVVALGLNTGQYVRATGTISRSNNNVISLVAARERNYANPSE